MKQNAGDASQINRVNMWLLRDAVSDSTHGFPMRRTEVTEFLWLARHTDPLCPLLLPSVGLPASDLALERRAILWDLGPCLSPVVHNFFTMIKCQGWSFFSDHMFFFSSWLKQPRQLSTKLCPETRLCYHPLHQKFICQPNTAIN